MLRKTYKTILAASTIIFLVGCSGWKTVSFREFKKIEQLRGQPPKIIVYTSDFSKLYHFSNSTYYIRNDTLFGKGSSGKEIVLTKIGSIQYYYEINQDVDVYYDSVMDSVVGHKYAGAKAYIKMNDGADYTGEILIVRDSIMIVCEEYDADEQDLADSVYAIYVLNNYDIEVIGLYVGNYLGTGIFVGAITGMVAGGAIFSDSGPSGDWGAMAGAFGGLFVGSIIGGLIGGFSSDYDIIYEYANNNDYDFKKLNIYARYVNNEPEFLKKLK